MPGTAKYNGRLCTVTPGCKRKQRYQEGACEPCHFRALDEGSYEKPENPLHEERRKMVAEYNKLIRSGLRPFEIAQLWNMPRRTLASKVYVAKRSGLKVISGAAVVQGKPLIPTSDRVNKAYGHGEGKKGKRGCRCDLCMAARRATWRESSMKYSRNRSKGKTEPQ